MKSLKENYWKNAVEIDFGLVSVVVLGFGWWLTWGESSSLKCELFGDNRIRTYGYAVVLGTALLGLSLTVTSIILSYWHRPRLKKLRLSENNMELFDALTHLSRSSVGLMVAGLFGVAWFGTGFIANIIAIVAVFCLSLSFVRLLRVLRLVRKFVAAMAQEPNTVGKAPELTDTELNE